MKQIYLLLFSILIVFSPAESSMQLSVEPFKGIKELGSERFKNQAAQIRENGEKFFKRESLPDSLVDLEKPIEIKLNNTRYLVTSAIFYGFDEYKTALDGLTSSSCIPYVRLTDEENPMAYYYAGSFGNALFTVFRARLKPII